MKAVAQFRSKNATESLPWSVVMDACPASIAVIESGDVLRANQAFAQMFGVRNPSDLHGRPLTEFVPAALFPADTFAKSLQYGELGNFPSREFTRALPGNCSDAISMEAAFSLLHLHGRNLLVVSIRDISPLKRLEQQLRQARRMEAVGRLLGGVVHDFNNLLTGIMLYCDLLTAGLTAHPHLLRYAEEIHITGEHGAALIQQLLTVARQHVVEPRELSWNDAVSSMRNLLLRLLREDIKFTTSLAENLGRMRMDSTQAQQVILNLVLNARDSMPEGGRITLKTRNCIAALPRPGAKQRRTGCVELTVTDTGSGMGPETRAHAFDAFFTTKEPGQGSGLGLSTVAEIVKQDGGSIALESVPGRGTRVVVRLQRVREPAQTISPPTPIAAPRHKILLVEDNSAVRQAACQVLGDCGYKLLEAQSGLEALRICRSHKGTIDLLLTDLHLPGMAGREVASQLRLLRPNLRLLYMSGYDNRPAGPMDDQPIVVFRKPFTASALVEKVREVLLHDRKTKRETKQRTR